MRLGSLDRAFEYILSLDQVPTDLLHTMMAIYIWLCSCWRPGMAVVSATFEYVRVYRGLVRELWPTVRDEVNMMRGFIPFLMLDMGRTKAPIVLAQDAAGPTKRAGSERKSEPPFACRSAAHDYW